MCLAFLIRGTADRFGDLAASGQSLLAHEAKAIAFRVSRRTLRSARSPRVPVVKVGTRVLLSQRGPRPIG